MSKREDRAPDGRVLPVFVRSFEELGYLPEAMINYLALLGWSFDDKTEIMSREELIERFSLDRVNASPAVWNYEKLDHLNGYYIRQLPIDELARRLLPFVQAAGFAAGFDKIVQIAPLIQERITTLADVLTAGSFFLVEDLPPYDPAELIPKKGDAALALNVLKRARQALENVEFTHEALDAALRAEALAAGVKPGDLFQPVRVAVCGRKAAPPLFETLEVLGRETCLKRIGQAIEKLQ
jgi:glutamyl-tRNA synthetase